MDLQVTDVFRSVNSASESHPSSVWESTINGEIESLCVMSEPPTVTNSFVPHICEPEGKGKDCFVPLYLFAYDSVNDYSIELVKCQVEMFGAL